MTTGSIDHQLSIAFKESYGRILSSLIKFCGDFELAEDCLQEAMAKAVQEVRSGRDIQNMVAWLTLVAKNKIIDHARRSQRVTQFENMESLDAFESPADFDSGAEALGDEMHDERLTLIFTCCHPAIDEKVRVALTLKTVCGLNTDQIASAYLTNEKTMAQRIVRAKRKIKSAGIPFAVPPENLLEERVQGVLRVIYLIFNEGYFSSHSKELVSNHLCEEAIFLGTLVCKLMPNQIEAVGLLALMYFHHSRIEARTDRDGGLVKMEDQNRSIWNRNEIATADKLLKGALMKGQAGPYQIQAAISAVHAHSKSFSDTDWKQIVLLYRRLLELEPSPVVQINLAVALSYGEDPETGLKYLESIKGLDKLKTYHPYHATKAALLEKTGDVGGALDAYQEALKLCSNQVEINYFQERISTLSN